MAMSLSVRHYDMNMLASMLSNSAFGNLASFLVREGGMRSSDKAICKENIYPYQPVRRNTWRV